MKKYYYLLPALSMFLSSCMFFGSDEAKVEYYAVQEEKDGKWGFVNQDGELVISGEYKNEPSVVVNGYFSVQEGENKVLYKMDKKPEAVPGCDELADVGTFEDGVIPVVKKGSRISIVNGKGETITTLDPQGGKEITRCGNSFSDGMLMVVTEDGKFGYVNTKGEYVVSPKYDLAAPFSEGLALVAKEKDDDLKISVIDTKGDEVFSLKKDYKPGSTEYKDGYIAVKEGDRFLMIDKKGESIKLPGKVEQIFDYNDKYIVFCESEYSERGLMKLDEENPEIVIKPRYESITLIPDDKNKVLVSEKNEFTLMNVKGEKEFDFNDDYTDVIPLQGKKVRFMAKDHDKYVFLDKEGKPIDKNDYNDAAIYPNRIFVYSDYFSVEGFVEAMLSDVTDKGIGKYYIGEPATSLGLGNAQNYTWKSSFENEELNKEGFRYSIDFSGECDAYIARSEYNYYGYYYSGSYSYSFNPYAEVESLKLSGYVPEGKWKEIRPALVNALKAKGFKVEKDDKEEYGEPVYFTNANVGVAIGTIGDVESGVVLIMTYKNRVLSEIGAYNEMAYD